MAARAGKAGSVQIDTDVVLEIESWSLSIDAGLVDSHALGDSWGETTQTIKKWTATVNFRWDADNDTTGQRVLEAAVVSGATVSDLKLYVDATNFYTGGGKIANENIDCSVEDLVTGSFEIMGEGALTLPAYA